MPLPANFHRYLRPTYEINPERIIKPDTTCSCHRITHDRNALGAAREDHRLCHECQAHRPLCRCPERKELAAKA
jgi:hypothetical protein